VLGDAKSEEARELVVDNVLHIFRETWAAFWGPRSDHVMRAALSTLVHARAPDGSAYTLCEVVPLLTQATFRRSVVASADLPLSLRGFWQWYENLSDGERTQAIGPVINKVEVFSSRTPIRLMLGQSQGLDLTTVFTQRKALLVSLAKGRLGSETAALLGSLLVSSLWQATLARVNVPAEKRRPVFAYLDEMQDIVRLPLGLSDMLAQARGLGLGVTLATQFIAQLPEQLRAAVLGTVRTLVTFQIDHDDARLLAKRFAPLTADDLMGLLPYEVALKPCVNGQMLTPVTGTTLFPRSFVMTAAAGRSGDRPQPRRVRTSHVAWVAERLSERDRAIIGSVARLRLATSVQLERLHFHDLAASARARVRRRVLARLVTWRVLMTMPRRIGGIRAGSSGLVFALDSAGQHLSIAGTGSARRPREPSLALLGHTLAVSELYVALVELSQRTGGFQVSDYQTEPACWHANGFGGWLKPDAYLKLSTEQFDDYWWIEADKGTEHLPTIRRKLQTYLDHVHSGGSGPEGITPRVLVMVPGEERWAALAELVRHLPDPAGKLLHVATESHAPKYLLEVLRE
jgi:hypothetical protein